MNPVLLLSFCFTTGLLVGFVLPASLSVGISASVACAVLIVLSIRLSVSKSPSLLLFAFILGWIRPPDMAPSSDDSTAPCVRVIEGAVIEPPVQLKDGVRAVVEIRRRSACLDGPFAETLSVFQGTLFVTVLHGPWTAMRGEHLLLRAQTTPLLPNRNPGAPRNTSDSPLFAATLDNVSEIATIVQVSSNLRNLFDGKRASLSAFFSRVSNDSSGATAKALVLGETASLPFDVKEDYRRSGCSHLLSVSGLHLALASAFAFLILRFWLVRTRLAAQMDIGRIAAFFAMIPTIGFTLLTGCNTPVVRACVMTMSALLARILKRPQGGVESLALAALSILTVRPNDLFDPGFQLSFAAVVGFFIVFSRPRNNDEHNDIQVSRAVRIRSFAVRLLRSTLAAHAATAPIALYHFGVVSWISPLANLVAVPMSEFVIMPILFVALIIEPLSQTVSAWMIKFACLLIQMLNNFLSYLSEFPCTIESPGIFATISIVALSVTLLFAATKIRTSGLAAAVCLGLTALAVLFDPPKIAPGFLTVHFFDVGQGDSALITSPKGRHLLVDGGPLTRSGFNTGERVIVPALRSLHVSSLDSVYSTHPDSDHIGGLPAVIRALRVKRLFENGQEGSTNPQDLYRDLLAVATSRHVTLLRAPSICRSIEFDGASVEVIHPCNPTASGADASDTNDNSLVIVVKLKRVSLLMLGDISESVETMLARSGRFPTADIVKVAHHGSQTSTSSAMLDRVQPIFAVISVGRFNRFGMPHREVIERLTHRNIRIMRTDLLGPIVFRTDGRVIEIGPLDIK